MKPQKNCTRAGCRQLVDFDKRFCDKHKSQYQWRKSYEGKYLKFYKSTDWVKQSKQFLIKNPLCIKCLSIDVIRKADVVDHIIPLKVDWSRRLDPTNWQPLCHSCHNEKTRAENKPQH